MLYGHLVNAVLYEEGRKQRKVIDQTRLFLEDVSLDKSCFAGLIIDFSFHFFTLKDIDQYGSKTKHTR